MLSKWPRRKQNGKILRLSSTFSETIVHSHRKMTSAVQVAHCELKKLNRRRLWLKTFPTKVRWCAFIQIHWHKYSQYVASLDSSEVVTFLQFKFWSLKDQKRRKVDSITNCASSVGAPFSKPWISTASHTAARKLPSEVGVLCQFPNCFPSSVFKENISNLFWCRSNCIPLLELSLDPMLLCADGALIRPRLAWSFKGGGY